MARSLFLLGRHKLGRTASEHFILFIFIFVFLLGALVLITLSLAAIEAYKQAENRSEAPDWEICHNLGRH